MRIRNLLNSIDEIIPQYLACDFDNVGLILGDNDKQVNKIMIALDATAYVVAQAIEKKVDLLITHHPIIFSSLKKINDESIIGRKIISLIKNDISCIAVHTNFDRVFMAKNLSDKLEINVLDYVGSYEDKKELALGIIGEVQESLLVDLAEKIKKSFSLEYVDIIGNKNSYVEKVCVIPGSGRSLINEAIKKGANTIITADITHHTAVDLFEDNINVISMTHFDMENIMKEKLKNILLNINKDFEIFIADENCPYERV